MLLPVIKKARQLQALADRTDSPSERLAAEKQKAYLLDKYRLTEAMLEVDAPELAEGWVADETSPIYCWGDRAQRWRRGLALVLCKHFGVAGWQLRTEVPPGRWRTKLCLCGTPSDVALVREYYGYLEPECVRLSVPCCKGRGRAFANSWLMGFVHGLSAQLTAARTRAQMEAEEDGQHSAAMVLWRDRGAKAHEALANLHPELKKVHLGNARVLRTAFENGYDSGNSVHVGRCLPGGGQLRTVR